MSDIAHLIVVIAIHNTECELQNWMPTNLNSLSNKIEPKCTKVIEGEIHVYSIIAMMNYGPSFFNMRPVSKHFAIVT